MGETPKSTFRFEDGTRKAIADLLVMKYGRDKTEVVSKAIVEMRDIVAGGGEVPEGVRVVSEKAVIKVGELAAEKAVEFPFHPLCKHCGENFGAFNRLASLCSDCKKERHIGEPRDCPECNLGGTGAL